MSLLVTRLVELGGADRIYPEERERRNFSEEGFFFCFFLAPLLMFIYLCHGTVVKIRNSWLELVLSFPCTGSGSEHI